MSEAIAGYLLFVLILLALFVYPWYFRCLRMLSVRMEEEYAEEWKLLGAPSLNGAMNLSGAIHLLRFVWSKGYSYFGDRTLVALGDKTRNLLLSGVFIFIMFLVVSWLANI